MRGHLNDNLFLLTALQGGLWETFQILLGPKIGPKIRFFTLYQYNPPFLSQSDLKECDHNNCIISYSIALLASACGLYLARHLSTLYKYALELSDYVKYM